MTIDLGRIIIVHQLTGEIVGAMPKRFKSAIFLIY